MPKHEFGIMERSPVCAERYDDYEPEKYHAITVDDDFIEPLLPELNRVSLFWHSLDVPGMGPAYYGVTLIPPESMDAIIDIIGNADALSSLKELLLKAKSQNKFVIHYGI